MLKAFSDICRALGLVAVAACLAACSGVPSGIVPPRDMSLILADLDMAEAVVEGSSSAFPTDSAKRAFRQSIFLERGYTPEQVDTSLAWYARHIDLYAEVCDASIEILEQRLQETRSAGILNSALPSANRTTSVDGDSVDVWSGARFLRLSPHGPSRVYSFNFNRDRNWEPGDLYTLAMKVYPTADHATGSPTTLDVALAVDYTGGKGTDYIYSSLSPSKDGWMRLTLALDPVFNPSTLYGSIIAPSQQGRTLLVDSLSLTRMRDKPGRRRLNAQQHHVSR